MLLVSAVGGAAWVVAVLLGVAAMWRDQRAPGAAAATAPRWPTDSRLARAAHGASVVMFVHPECPCSRASLTELQAVVRRAHPGAVAVVLMSDAEPESDLAARRKALEASANWALAQRVPGAQLTIDEDGSEARRFGALTSGQTFAYDDTGTLLFSGGVTVARGEVGPNRGEVDLTAAIVDRGSGRSSIDHAHVYGCPLARR